MYNTFVDGHLLFSNQNINVVLKILKVTLQRWFIEIEGQLVVELSVLVGSLNIIYIYFSTSLVTPSSINICCRSGDIYSMHYLRASISYYFWDLICSFRLLCLTMVGVAFIYLILISFSCCCWLIFSWSESFWIVYLCKIKLIPNYPFQMIGDPRSCTMNSFVPRSW